LKAVGWCVLKFGYHPNLPSSTSPDLVPLLLRRAQVQLRFSLGLLTKPWQSQEIVNFLRGFPNWLRGCQNSLPRGVPVYLPACKMFAPTYIVPLGRLHSFLKISILSASVKKTRLEISASLNLSILSPLSRFGRSRWIQPSRPSSSISSIFLILDFVWLPCLGYVPERCPWRLIGHRRRKRA
jgi:hypothetical protein